MKILVAIGFLLLSLFGIVCLCIGFMSTKLDNVDKSQCKVVGTVFTVLAMGVVVLYRIIVYQMP